MPCRPGSLWLRVTKRGVRQYDFVASANHFIAPYFVRGKTSIRTLVQGIQFKYTAVDRKYRFYTYNVTK